MLSADRRMQEGARDLAIALSLGRAEEALYRLRAGRPLTERDRELFDRVSELFMDAVDAYRSAESGVTSGQFKAPTQPALRAMRLVLPLVRDEAKAEPPTDYLEHWAHVAKDVSTGSYVSGETSSRFLVVLKRLALLAGADGLDALESKPATLEFPLMDRLA